MTAPLEKLCAAILENFRKHNSSNAFTIALSGIDGSGKGYIAKRLQSLLEQHHLRIALLHTDDWLMPETLSLLKENAAENFYHNAFRWNAFFDSLFLPLQKNRSVNVQVRLAKNIPPGSYLCHYNFSNTDIILVEGIFLLKKGLRFFFDFKIWTDCSFETAMLRALQRNQEGLPRQQLIEHYQTYYHPAQLLHFEKDNPRQAADYIFNNEQQTY